MTQADNNSNELTPVDDVRRVRERLDREAHGEIHTLAQQSQAAVERYRNSLNLKIIPAPVPSPSKGREPKTA